MTTAQASSISSVKRYADLKKKAVANVGGSVAWTNFTRRVHEGLMADQILTWQMSQDDSIPAERTLALTGELWGLMMADEEL